MYITLFNGRSSSEYFLESALMSTHLSKGLWLTLEKLFCPKFIFKFSFDKSYKQVSWILINISDKVPLLIVENLRHITGVSLSEWRQEVWLQLRLRGKCWIAGDTVLAGLYTITTPENIFCSNIFFSLTKKLSATNKNYLQTKSYLML